MPRLAKFALALRPRPSVLLSALPKFNFIFSGNLNEDARRVCHYIDAYYESLGLSAAEIDLSKVMGLVGGMVQDFPSPLGIADSSPFKKAASFSMYFAVTRPILTTLPVEIFGPLSTHQNSIVAVELALDALEGAQLHKDDGSIATLTNRIKMSDHYWKDLVVAISGCVPSHHFNCLSLIYESLAYQENTNASYPRA
jgi:hypothetical protein